MGQFEILDFGLIGNFYRKSVEAEDLVENIKGRSQLRSPFISSQHN
jgi:hypothetical protein